MIATRKDITQLLAASLVSEIDGCLADQSFRRQENSLRYSRAITSGTQILEICFNFNPSYAPGMIAHLLPQLSVVFPELNNTALKMAGGDIALIGSTDVTFSLQLTNAAPRDARLNQSDWFLSDHESTQKPVRSIKDFVQHWSIPFLNRYTTVEAIIGGYEQNDECLPHDRRFWLFIAAAYTLIGQPMKAMEVLELKFGKAGTRRQYAKAFEYVARIVG